MGDLDRSTTTAPGGWKAKVTVTIHDGADSPVVQNATVSGTWSGGTSGGGSCVTNSSGQCTITSATMNNKKTSATFTVTAVSHATYSYDNVANHDPDAAPQNSNGTSITVNKP